MNVIKSVLLVTLGVMALYIIGSFPVLAVSVTAIAIVFMFLVFGKE